MLAYWNNTFYLEYLSNPVGEHVPPGQTLLVTSKDGYQWSDPVIIFPPYKVPDGFKKKDREGVANNLYAVMHQRMGFYTAANKKLLALAYYGVAMDNKDDPNDGNGIGRVVREIKAGGKAMVPFTLSVITTISMRRTAPILFIRAVRTRLL